MAYKTLISIIAILAILSLTIIPKTTRAMPDEGALIKGLTEKVYVIEHGLKRWIQTADIFNKLGYSWANIVLVSENILNNIPPGKDIANSWRYPDGTLVKGGGPAVYLIESSVARWIPSPQIFTANRFKWQNIINITDNILSTIRKGQDVSSVAATNQVQTFILSGPCAQNQTSIPKITTGQIEFGYSGSDGQGNSANLSFETFLEGYDNDWRSSWSLYKRKIDLPGGTKTYTFYVRAKTKDGIYDTTPASCKFTTNLSSFYQQIEIAYVRNWGTNPAQQQIVLKTWKLSESIDMTGWTITTKKDSLTIPRAVKIVHPDSIFNVPQDLILENNDTITISGNASPIGINAYKTNKCGWYFPPASDEYRNCFYENNQYPDFLKDDWQIYLNRTSAFLADKEEIVLKDKNGLVVDKYSD